MLIASLVEWLVLIVCGLGINHYMDEGSAIGLLVGAYVFYVAIVCIWSDVPKYVSDLTVFRECANQHEEMVRGRGYFTFSIECYHFENRRDHKGEYSSVKIVTHSAKEDFHPAVSEDGSSALAAIKEANRYVFLHYLKKYEFADDQSTQIYSQTYHDFVTKNRRDDHQTYACTF